MEKLTSNIGFKCVEDGGGDCDKSALYWHFWGDLRVCPSWKAIASPEDRAELMLAALYGYKSVIKDDAKQDRAAKKARSLHAATVPSTAGVIRK